MCYKGDNINMKEDLLYYFIFEIKKMFRLNKNLKLLMIFYKFYKKKLNK